MYVFQKPSASMNARKGRHVFDSEIASLAFNVKINSRRASSVSLNRGVSACAPVTGASAAILKETR